MAQRDGFDLVMSQAMRLVLLDVTRADAGYRACSPNFNGGPDGRDVAERGASTIAVLNIPNPHDEFRGGVGKGNVLWQSHDRTRPQFGEDFSFVFLRGFPISFGGLQTCASAVVLPTILELVVPLAVAFSDAHW